MLTVGGLPCGELARRGVPPWVERPFAEIKRDGVRGVERESDAVDDEEALLVDVEAAERAHWLVLTYRIPSDPSRLRASAWRRLKALGAIYLVNSAAALPASRSAERALRKLRTEIIHEMGGSAVLLLCDPLGGASDLVAAFNAARDDEYEEIVDRCADFLAQVEKEIVGEHFTFAELEENEEDLTKLQRWFEKIRARDVLNADGIQRARIAIEHCEGALESFADMVYQRDGVERGDAG
jgi:hypothetical protein